MQNSSLLTINMPNEYESIHNGEVLEPSQIEEKNVYNRSTAVKLALIGSSILILGLVGTSRGNNSLKYNKFIAKQMPVTDDACEQLNRFGYCAECQLCPSLQNCKAKFSTSLCYPAPQAEICYDCYSEFGPDILPVGSKESEVSRTYAFKYRKGMLHYLGLDKIMFDSSRCRSISHICDKCSQCAPDNSACIEMFKTDTCWPAPKEEACHACYENFGSTIFPTRKFSKSSEHYISKK